MDPVDILQIPVLEAKLDKNDCNAYNGKCKIHVTLDELCFRNLMPNFFDVDMQYANEVLNKNAFQNSWPCIMMS